MSRTYGFLLRYLPRNLASAILTIWYVLLIVGCLYYIGLPVDDIIYWDRV